MGIAEIIILAAGLSTDAFAVSICKGLAERREFFRVGLACGLWFGFFQALMPFCGWLLGSAVSRLVERIAPYIAFGILAFLGVKMICGALLEAREEKRLLSRGITSAPRDATVGTGAPIMLPLAVATSIDALAAGLSLAALKLSITRALFAVTLVGVITFLLSFIGAAIGSAAGARLKTKAEIAGGAMLLAIALRILCEHLIKK